jgi:hypothetical protein
MGPEIDGIDRLDIVVTVNQDIAAALDMGVAGDDHRVFGGFVELGGKSHAGQFRHQPFRTGTHIPRVARIGGNTRKAQKRKEIFEFGGHDPMIAVGWTIPQGESTACGGKSEGIPPMLPHWKIL